MNVKWLNILCIAGLSGAAQSSHAVISREKAYDILTKSGFRWRQTEVLQLEADAKSAEAKSLRMPHIQFSVKEYVAKVNPLQYGLSIAADVDMIAIGTTGFELGFLLYDRSIFDKIDAAAKNQNLTAAQKEQYQVDLTSLMLVQFLNVQRLQKKLEALDTSRERAEEVLKIAQDKVSSGLGVKLDLMRAQSLVAAEKLKTLDAQMSLSKARQELATTLGREDLREDLEPLSVKVIDPVKLASSYSDTIELRPDIKVARLGIETSRLLSDSARHTRWPKAVLFGSLGMFQTVSVFGLGADRVNGSGGLGISMPIYSGGGIDAEEQKSAAVALKAEFQEQHMLLEAKSQLLLSIQQLKTAQAAIEVSERQVKMVEEELRLSKQKFQSGSGNGLDVTNTLVSFASAHDSNIDAMFAYEVAKVGFFKNSGSFKNYFAKNSNGVN